VYWLTRDSRGRDSLTTEFTEDTEASCDEGAGGSSTEGREGNEEGVGCEEEGGVFTTRGRELTEEGGGGEDSFLTADVSDGHGSAFFFTTEEGEDVVSSTEGHEVNEEEVGCEEGSDEACDKGDDGSEIFEPADGRPRAESDTDPNFALARASTPSMFFARGPK
jgi:hypothetical protein